MNCDSVTVSYPRPLTEIYVYKRGNSVLKTVTIVFEDRKKKKILTVTKS